MTQVGLRPEGVLAFVLLDIAIILIVARLVGALARKVGQPAVVGEILAGVLLGPTLLGRTVFAWDKPWGYLQCKQALTTLPPGQRLPSITSCFFPSQARSVLGILGQIALVLFMFLVGLELDFTLLKGKVKGILTVAIGVVAVPIALGFAIAPSLYNSKFVAMFGSAAQPSKASFSLMIGAMLSVTAFPVMARILQEKKLTQSAMGSIGIAAAAVVTVLMFLTVAVASGVASNQGPSSLAIKFLLTAVFIATLFLVVRPALAPLGRAYQAKGTVTPNMFAAIVVLLFLSAYVAHKLGINVIVGGFLAGAVLPARAGLFRDMAARLADVTAIVLLPIFLAFSGLATDFTKLGLSFLAGIAIFLVAGIFGKWAGGAVFARMGGLSWAEGNVIGILMNCRGLLVLVVALIAFQQNVISAPMQVGGVLMALVTTGMTGPLFDKFSKKLPKAPPGPVPVGAPEAAAPGATRVLAATFDLDLAPGVAQAAFDLVGDRRPAEVLLCRLFPLPAHGGLLSGINDEQAEAERSTQALNLLADFRPAGVEVMAVSAASADIASDLIRLAEDHGCEQIVVGWAPAWAGAIGALLDRAPQPVTVHAVAAAGCGRPSGPVVLIDEGDSSGQAAALATRLAARRQAAVETVPATAMAEAASRGSALVVSARPGSAQAGEALAGISAELLTRGRCPVYVCRPAGVLAGGPAR